MNVLRLVKSLLIGFSFCVLSTVFVSFFAFKVNKLFVDSFPFVFASIGSFLCAKYFVHNMKRNRFLCSIASSLIMSLIFILVSCIVWKEFPTKNSLLRTLIIVISGSMGSLSFGMRPKMKRAKRYSKMRNRTI